MAKYRIGIIGHTGRGNYGHGLDLPWQHLDACEVVAVSDPHEGGRQAAIRRTGAARGYADYQQMLKQERPDIAVICPRWIDQHRDMVLACADYGCHMYLEKPFCQDLEQADEIVRACEMRHLKLAIAHTNRYSPVVRTVRRLLRDGEIGDVLEIRARGKEDARRGGGEDLWVLGTHMLDLACALAGEPESCFATVRQDGVPVERKHVGNGNEGIGPLAGDHVQSLFRFKSGVTGYFASKRGAGGGAGRFGMQIFGSRGIIELQSGYLKPAALLRDPAWSPGRTGSEWSVITSAGVDQPETETDGGHGGANLVAARDLLSSIEGDRQPVSSVYDARTATELIIATFESHRTGGPVSLPLKNRRHPLTLL